MANHILSSTDVDEPLKHWRQGDFALEVGGFLYAGIAEGNEPFQAEVTYDDIVGHIVISQTCDIVRRTGGRYFVAACPLVKVNEQNLSEIRKGRRPYFTDVENTDEEVVADLRRVMSVHKDVLQTWERQSGFSNDMTRLRFAAALERKFGQFAFPDDFDRAISKFRQRVWSRHTKPGSEPGAVYRSLYQIRFRADPDWSAEVREISVIVIMNDEENREADDTSIRNELDDIHEEIEWPNGYTWAEPKFICGTAKNFTAEDILSSQRGDFDFLCY